MCVCVQELLAREGFPSPHLTAQEKQQFKSTVLRSVDIPYSGYYSRGSIFAGGGTLSIARVIRGFKIRGPNSPPAMFRGFIFRG